MNFTEKDIENCKKIYSKLSEKKFNKLLKKQDELNLSNNLRSTLQKIRLNGGSYDMIPNMVGGSNAKKRTDEYNRQMKLEKEKNAKIIAKRDKEKSLIVSLLFGF